ncbi:hypothetical protein ABW21_db0201399 [Orbilia brochopaga]|nr:hypothetical protein ABW21_db0201399 [Drechslerella brochopaga]
MEVVVVRVITSVAGKVVATVEEVSAAWASVEVVDSGAVDVASVATDGMLVLEEDGAAVVEVPPGSVIVTPASAQRTLAAARVCSISAAVQAVWMQLVIPVRKV